MKRGQWNQKEKSTWKWLVDEYLFLVSWCWIVWCKLMVMANIWCCACLNYVQATNNQSFCLELLMTFDDGEQGVLEASFKKWVGDVQNKMVD